MKYFLGIAGSILLFIVLMVILLSGSSTTVNTTLKPKLDLLALSNGTSEIRITTLGPIEAEENFEGQRMTISAAQRKIEHLKGYALSVDKEKTYVNNAASYDALLRALNQQSLNASREFAENTKPDQRGICADGELYQIEIFDAGKSVYNVDSNSCSSKLGTFAGSLSGVLSLINNQFPDYSDYSL